MRSSINFIIILLAVLICLQIAGAQNVTVQLIPPNPPIEIPENGGSFTYQVSITNHEATPQQVTLWCLATTPTGDQRLALQPYTAGIAPGATVLRPFTQSLPASAPTGNYLLTANVGIYPNTVWDSDHFTFYKLKPAEWVARYSGPYYDDQANSLAVDSFGNVYVTGSSWGTSTHADYATIKYDANGNQLWVARYNGPGNGFDGTYSLAIDSFGNVYVTGYSEGNGTDHDYATIKYNNNGNQLWVARYNGPASWGDEAHSLAVDGCGNVYVTGYSFGIGTGSDYATIKYDANGNQLWVARYSGPGNNWDKGNILEVDSLGNVYVTGNSTGIGTNYDYATIKYDTDGNQLWVTRYNGPGNYWDLPWSLALDHLGNVYVTGSSAQNGTSPYNYDYATIKYDANGNQLWVARYNGIGDSTDEAISLAVDINGDVFVTGSSWGGTTSKYDYATVKYNTNGNQLWVARYNEAVNEIDEAYSLAIDYSGNIYVTGESYGSGTGYDYATIKYDTNGNQLWVARYDGLGNAEDRANSLALDGSGNVYVTGESTGNRNNYDYCTIKYSATDLPDWQPPVATVFGAPLPSQNHLEPNCPNPFNPTTVLSFELRVSSLVNLSIYDISGRLVTTLVNGWRDAGKHQVTFDGSNLASGIYLARLQAGDYTGVQKMVLVK